MKALRWLKPTIFVLSLVPFLRLFWLGYQGDLGANPIEFITHSTGFWTLTFLCLTLTITPLRRLTGWQLLIRLRRMLGLFAFFYGLAHLTTYVWFDQWFSIEDIVKDIWKRPFITVGFAAFLLLVPLAVTSTNRMMKRLGRRWSQLHRLIYLIVLLGVVHFWWLKQDKNDLSEPLIFSGIIAVLLLFRLLHPLWQRFAKANAGTKVAPAKAASTKGAFTQASPTKVASTKASPPEAAPTKESV